MTYRMYFIVTLRNPSFAITDLLTHIYAPASCRPSDKLRTGQDLENFNCQKIDCESVDRSQSASKIEGNLKSLSPRA